MPRLDSRLQSGAARCCWLVLAAAAAPAPGCCWLLMLFLLLLAGCYWVLLTALFCPGCSWLFPAAAYGCCCCWLRGGVKPPQNQKFLIRALSTVCARLTWTEWGKAVNLETKP